MPASKVCAVSWPKLAGHGSEKPLRFVAKKQYGNSHFSALRVAADKSVRRARLARGICQGNPSLDPRSDPERRAFTNFTYFEAPLPAQDLDFVLLFELKSFSSLDTRRIPPHYEVLFQRLGPERGEALLKEMGGWEQKVTVRILRANKV